MPATLDLDDEYTIFDNTEIVTLVNPGGATVTTSYALKRASQGDPITQNEFSVVLITCRWHVWPAALSDTTFVPARDGYVQDAAGNRWRINNVNLVTLQSRYELDTTLEAGKGLR